ncbi:unnamed protein product [Trichobilharzia szidati]|nr:unnamed protein product [Trichobilharzia szidati]
MIPFPSGSVDSFANLLSVPQNLLNASLLNANGLNIQSLTGQPSGLHFAGHPSPMRNLCMGLAVPIINAASVIPVANLGVGVLPSVPYGSAGCLNPLMYYQAAVGQTNQSSIHSHNTGPPDSAAHTIVRGPVLYKSATNQESSTTKGKEESPPDRIVASYAAAAHAAALACHQPISRAAEAYLATTSNSRSRHSSKRSRTVNHHLISTAAAAATGTTTTTTTFTGNNKSNIINYATSLSSLALLPSTTTSLIPSETNSEESHQGWTRRVDRKTNNVVYISSDGIHMRNIDDVYAYLSAKYPSECCLSNPSVKEMIATQFIFTPTNNSNNTIHSLADTIKFVHSLQVSALKNNTKHDDNHDGNTVSQLNTTHSPSKSSTTENSVHNYSSPEKTSSICRINFNPDHHSANYGTLPAAKRSKLSDDTTSCAAVNGGESNGLSVSLSSSSSSDDYSTVCCSTQSSISSASSNPIECSVKQDLSNVSNTLDTLTTDDRAACCIQSSDVDRDQCHSTPLANNRDFNNNNNNNSDETIPTSLSTNTTHTNDYDGDISNRTSQNNIVQNGNINNNSNNIIAKLTTETLTTGALRTSMPSFTTEIVPSVFAPNNKQVVDLTNLQMTDDPCQLNLITTGSLNALQQQHNATTSSFTA